MPNEAMIRCWKCHNFVRLKFTRVDIPVKKHWRGKCSCGADNFIYKPSWDKEAKDA